MIDALIGILTNPTLINLLGPIGVVLAVICGVLYFNYKSVLKKYMELQEKRVSENQNMQKIYYELAHDVDKTLEMLLTSLDKKKNDGGDHGGKGDAL